MNKFKSQKSLTKKFIGVMNRLYSRKEFLLAFQEAALNLAKDLGRSLNCDLPHQQVTSKEDQHFYEVNRADAQFILLSSLAHVHRMSQTYLNTYATKEEIQEMNEEDATTMRHWVASEKLLEAEGKEIPL